MTKTTNERFTISTEGMAELHKDREPWALIKELIANAWDEDSADRCDVTITAMRGGVRVKVEDNGTGFSDINDSYTLLAPSKKRGEIKKRGRFNVGEKEILSIAVSAKVISPGTTVTFPKGGGRRVDNNKRKRGTIIEAVMDWKADIIPDTVAMLARFIAPDGETFTINGTDYSTSLPVFTVFNASLDSVLQGKEGRGIRWTTAKTDVIVRKADEGWLYELGIPVQKIEPPYLVDVQQKIPLSQMRDMAPAGYLQSLYAELLNAVADDIADEDSGAAWIHSAISKHKRINEEAVAKVVKGRYGDKVALWSSDTQANEDAQVAGYTILHPNSLSQTERTAIKQVVPTSGKLFPDPTGLRGVEDATVTPAMEHVAEYAKWLGEGLLAETITVEFKNAPMTAGKGWLARYTESARLLAFNVQLLGVAWFEGKINAKHTSLILHELAHHGDSKTPHQGDYVDRLADLSAEAIHLALTAGRDGWFK